MKTPVVHTTKLDDRSTQVVNLGREPGTKAYRVYDPVTDRVYVSLDVVFEESKCWPWSQIEERECRTTEISSELNVYMPPDVVQVANEQDQNEDAGEASPQQSDCEP